MPLAARCPTTIRGAAAGCGPKVRAGSQRHWGAVASCGLKASSGIQRVVARLGLNGVGGKSGLNVARLLQPGSHFVTYGGMSREPVTLPTSLFIFKDIRAQGFWLSRWNSLGENAVARFMMIKEILQLQSSMKMMPPKLPHVDLKDLLEHINKAKVLIT